MTLFQSTPSLAGPAPAVLIVPQPLTPQALHELELALSGTIGILRRGLRGSAADADGFDHTVRRPSAGEVEYASWMPDPGAIEYASWTAQLQTSRQ